MSTYQLCVLLLFNDTDKLTFREIADATGIPPAELKRSLQSLACVKGRNVLRKEPMSKDVGEEDAFLFNDRFASALVKVKIGTVVAAKESEPEKADTRQRVEEDRKPQIEAAVVRIMKVRGGGQGGRPRGLLGGWVGGGGGASTLRTTTGGELDFVELWLPCSRRAYLLSQPSRLRGVVVALLAVICYPSPPFARGGGAVLGDGRGSLFLCSQLTVSYPWVTMALLGAPCSSPPRPHVHPSPLPLPPPPASALHEGVCVSSTSMFLKAPRACS